MMSCAVIRQSRTVVEECLKWCNQRMVFGKKLIEQPAIRQKFVSSLSHSCYIANITLDSQR
jgi:hypothetical protein